MIISTTGKTVQAMTALDEIRGQKISKVKAKELHHLRTVMQETVDFYMQQVSEIAERLGLTIDMGGTVTFGNDMDKRVKFLKEMAEMEATEAKLDVDMLDLTEEDISISENFVANTAEFVKV